MPVVVVVNLSKKKTFRKSKRIVSAVLPQVSKRVNLGDIPVRVLLELIRKLKEAASRGTKVKIFYEAKQGYVGMKCVEVGSPSNSLEPFVMCDSNLDPQLRMAGWIP